MLACAADHPFAMRSEIPLDTLAGETLAVLTADFGTRRAQLLLRSGGDVPWPPRRVGHLRLDPEAGGDRGLRIGHAGMVDRRVDEAERRGVSPAQARSASQDNLLAATTHAGSVTRRCRVRRDTPGQTRLTWSRVSRRQPSDLAARDPQRGACAPPLHQGSDPMPAPFPRLDRLRPSRRIKLRPLGGFNKIFLLRFIE